MTSVWIWITCDQIRVCLTAWVTCNVSAACSSRDVYVDFTSVTGGLLGHTMQAHLKVLCKIVAYVGLYFSNHFDHVS